MLHDALDAAEPSSESKRQRQDPQDADCTRMHSSDPTAHAQVDAAEGTPPCQTPREPTLDADLMRSPPPLPAPPVCAGLPVRPNPLKDLAMRIVSVIEGDAGPSGIDGLVDELTNGVLIRLLDAFDAAVGAWLGDNLERCIATKYSARNGRACAWMALSP